MIPIRKVELLNNNVKTTRKKEMLPFYTEGNRKLVRKTVEKVYGKEDY
jgi:hypothetical protein